jgi:hypothetical protein
LIKGEHYKLQDCKFFKVENFAICLLSNFRSFFKASLQKLFLVQADTFDNVKGKFPIAFLFGT